MLTDGRVEEVPDDAWDPPVPWLGAERQGDDDFMNTLRAEVSAAIDDAEREAIYIRAVRWAGRKRVDATRDLSEIVTAEKQSERQSRGRPLPDKEAVRARIQEIKGRSRARVLGRRR